MHHPSFQDIAAAHERISKYIHHTPVLTSKSINDITSAKLYFKCENFQKVGAFKFRGATNAVLTLNQDDAKKGVATHSSGNHAAALALAARSAGIRCYVVMPENAPRIKIEAVKGYGAEITFCEPTLEARESTLAEVVIQTGAVFIHPYDNFQVICGQGTAAKELLKEIPNLDIIMAPVGGGGLLSGTAIVSKNINKNIQVIAGEPAKADDAYRSFKSGTLVPSLKPTTIADGLLTSLSELTFEIINSNVDDIITVSEASIVSTMKMIWERMKIIIEPSSAVPVAAVYENPDRFRGKRTGIILSGGNVELTKLPF